MDTVGKRQAVNGFKGIAYDMHTVESWEKYNRAYKSARRGRLRINDGKRNIIWGDIIDFAHRQNLNANFQHETMDIETRNGS